MHAWPWLWKMANARPVRRRRQVGVVEHDVGALAAQLELDALEVAGRGLDDPAADRGRAGERRSCARSGCSARWAPATWPRPGTMLTTPGGNPTSAISSAIRSEDSGVSSAGLSTTVLPAARAGPIFQLREHQREVPRHDLADHAERLAQHVVQEAGLDRHDARPGTCRPCRRSSGRSRPSAGRRGRGVADRMAGVERLEPGELVGVALDRVGQLQQEPARARRRPCALQAGTPRARRRPRGRRRPAWPPRPRRASTRRAG